MIESEISSTFRVETLP